MPKKDEDIKGVLVTVCDGCGRVTEEASEGGFIEATDGPHYCASCAEIRADDPPVTIHGRTLLLSELEAQAEAGDKDLKAALGGDTVQEQVKAARGKR
jgi:hypothetical protein